MPQDEDENIIDAMISKTEVMFHYHITRLLTTTTGDNKKLRAEAMRLRIFFGNIWPMQRQLIEKLILLAVYLPDKTAPEAKETLRCADVAKKHLKEMAEIYELINDLVAHAECQQASGPVWIRRRTDMEEEE